MRPFKPEHYYEAAIERLGQALGLYRAESSIALCMYVAGLAVECMLRAFRGRRDLEFDEKHDLRKLFKTSGILALEANSQSDLTEEQIDQFKRAIQIAVEEVILLWSNDYRFASEQRLRSHLKKNNTLRRKVRGDILKATALRLLNASQILITRGAQLWQLS